MIFSRFGSEFKPTAKDTQWPNEPWLFGTFAAEGDIPESDGRWVSPVDLKATEGWKEITDLADTLATKKFAPVRSR